MISEKSFEDISLIKTYWKTLIIIFTVLFLLSSSISFGQDFGKDNGYKWFKMRTWAEEMFSRVDWANKEEWVKTVENGLKQAYILSIFNLTTYWASQLQPIKFDSTCYCFNYGEMIRGVTIDQAMQSLDKFYEDYKNKNILILDALSITQMEVSGRSNKEIEWQILYYRADEDARKEMANKRFIYDNKQKRFIDMLLEGEE